MTINPPLWLQNAGTVYTAQGWREHLTASMSQGVIGVGDWKVSQYAAGANMKVDISAGSGVVVGTEAAGQGAYLVTSDAVETVTLDASPSSGQSRIDLVIATIRDSSISGADDDMIFDKVTGDPSTGTPAVPTLPASSMLLAQVPVAGLASSIVDANIIDKRVQSGSPLTFGSSSLPPSFTGQLISDGTHVYQGSGGAWVRVDTPKVKTATYTMAAASYGGAGVWQTWAFSDGLQIAAPGYACTARVDANFMVSKAGGYHRLGLSGNNGTSWSTSESIFQSSSGVLDIQQVGLHYVANFDGSGIIKARIEGNCDVAGGMTASIGTYTLTVFPR